MPWFSDRWFHVVVLPAVWVPTIVALWMAVWDGGDRVFLALSMALPPVLWLAWLSRFVHLGGGYTDVLVLTLMGLPAVVLVGYLQDLLRVNWRILIAYFLVPVAAAAYWCLRGNPLEFDVLLAVLCGCLYVFSILSCLIDGLHRLIDR